MPTRPGLLREPGLAPPEGGGLTNRDPLRKCYAQSAHSDPFHSCTLDSVASVNRPPKMVPKTEVREKERAQRAPSMKGSVEPAGVDQWTVLVPSSPRAPKGVEE